MRSGWLSVLVLPSLLLALPTGCAVDDAPPGPEPVAEATAALDGPVVFCGLTPPSITSMTFQRSNVSGDNGAFLARGNIVYTPANHLDVVLKAPECSNFDQVQVNGVAIGTTTGPDGGNRFELVSNTVNATTGERTMIVRLWVGHSTTGTSKNITMGVRTNGLTSVSRASRTFAMVGVADFGRESRMSISADELHNQVVQGLYNSFRDDGWQRDEYGEKTGFYGPDYGSVSFSIGASGISFYEKMHYHAFDILDYHCDATVQVTGTFKLAIVDHTFAVQWVTAGSGGSPYALSFDLPVLCGGIDASLLATLDSFVENFVTGPVKRAIGDSIADSFACNILGLDCANLINRFEYKAGELIAVVDNAIIASAPGDSITIDVPYHVEPLEDPTSFGVLVGAGERVLVTSEGLAQGCVSDSANPLSCSTRSIGQRGIFNWNQRNALLPVPDPYEYGWPALEQRIQARGALRGVWRTLHPPAGSLFLPELSVGALTGRLSDGGVNGLRQLISNPCIVETPSTAVPHRLALGTNDLESPYGQSGYGSGTRRVTLRFQAFPGNCPQF